MAKGKAKKPAAKKSPAKKAAKKSAKKPAAKKAAPKKTAVKKAAPKKAVAKKPAVTVKKTAAKKSVAKKAVVKATVAKGTPKKINLSNFVTPLDDRVIVQMAGAERMTPGGLYIPDTVADVSGNLEGIVIAVGRGHRNNKGHVRPMDLKVGDKVVFSEYAGTKLKVQDQDVLILRESDVLGVIS